MKTKQISFFASLLLMLGVLLFSSCHKNPAAPSPKAIATGPAVTIQQLRNSYAGMNQKFTSNTILNAVVTCDESSGNLYKQVYIRDNSGTFATTNYYGALSVHFLHSSQGFLNVGDSIAINLNGGSLNKSSGSSLEIDSLEARISIIHLKSGLAVPPLTVTAIPQLNTYVNTTGGGFIYDGQLVQLSNIEFVAPNVGTTYAVPQAPPAAPQNVNKYINDFTGNTIVAYNSGYANFAGQTIPSNSGSIVAISNLYTTMQLTLRSAVNGDINLTNGYSPMVYDTITQNFSCAGLSGKSAITTAGWKTIAYQGSLNWQGLQYGNASLNANPTNWKYVPSASNYKTADSVNDMWLISPPIVDLGGTPTKKIDFSTALQYGTSKRLLRVYVSRSFDGTNIIPSQWTDVSSFFPTIATTSTNGYPSFKYAHGNSSPYNPSPVSLTVGVPGSTPTFYVAFRYRTNSSVLYPDSTGSTYLLGSFVLRN
jgi:hypothetical protein